MAEKSKHEAEMEAYQKLAMPGAPHRVLASMAGSWTTTIKSWMEPGKPPMESAGTSEQKMILGGRYLHQEFNGDMIGRPFTGIGITGYDNHKKRYVSTWMDSMSTGIYCFEGVSGEDDNTITMECRTEDLVRGPMKWRSVTTILDDNTHLFEMYGTDKSDKEQKMMEITYRRK
jgi:hypothetical protein